MYYSLKLFPIYCHYCTGEVVLRIIEIGFALLFALTVVGCAEINPAGPATYINPTYPNSQKGYFFCGQDPGNCVFAPGTSTVWISVPAAHGLFFRDVSRAVVNPFLVDTLFLKFAPDLLAAPSSGSRIYVTVSGGKDIYEVDTEELSYQNVYSSSSSISTIRVSTDGSALFLGSQGAPWHVESVSTESWEQLASFDTDWPVQRLELAPDNSQVAIANSSMMDIVTLDFSSLVPVDTLHMPMRIGTMAFLQNSTQIAVFDASSGQPYMIKVDTDTGEELFRSRPVNSYLINTRMTGTDVLLLPRSQDSRLSVINMENMVFAPSLFVEHRVSSVCVSSDGAYIVTVSRTATPGRATVFHYEN